MSLTVLVTGANRGIGKLIAEELLKRGHAVVAAMREGAEFEGFDVEGEAETLFLDYSSKAHVEKSLEGLRVDGVVNNAGYGLFCPIELATEEEMMEQMRVNFLAPLWIIQALVPYMREQKFGRIINISSIASQIAHPFLGMYCASKAALESASFSLRENLRSSGIFVSVVQPGRTKSGFGRAMPLGERAKGDPLYGFDLSKARDALVHGIDEGQPTEEVATLVADIVESDKPEACYQTSDQGREIVGRILRDPTRGSLFS